MLKDQRIMDGVEIRSLRKGMGLTQEEFAHEIGVTFATVNRWENGKSEPSRLAMKMLTAVDNKNSVPAKRAASKSGRRKSR